MESAQSCGRDGGRPLNSLLRIPISFPSRPHLALAHLFYQPGGSHDVFRADRRYFIILPQVLRKIPVRGSGYLQTAGRPGRLPPPPRTLQPFQLSCVPNVKDEHHRPQGNFVHILLEKFFFTRSTRISILFSKYQNFFSPLAQHTPNPTHNLQAIDHNW